MNIVTVLPYSASHAMTTAANGATGSTSSSSSSTSSSSNELNGNSFITLLTAQLQAQDPMDPDQMMDELVSMNSLEQLIGIKQDLDNLTGATTGSGTTPSGSS